MKSKKIWKAYIIFVMCFAMVFSLTGCKKKDKESKEAAVGYSGNQINVDSFNAPGGQSENEETDLEIGKEKSDTIIIVIDWNIIKIDDNECGSIDEMKNQIVKSGCKKIDLQHTNANKQTLDEVVDVLKEIESTLEIDVNYN